MVAEVGNAVRSAWLTFWNPPVDSHATFDARQLGERRVRLAELEDSLLLEVWHSPAKQRSISSEIKTPIKIIKASNQSKIRAHDTSSKRLTITSQKWRYDYVKTYNLKKT